MLRVNTSLVLLLPLFESTGADERLRESRDKMRIEQRLNKVGRGRLLASSQTTREQWVDALHDFNAWRNVAAFRIVDDDTFAFRISCLYSMLRSNPAVVYLP